MNVAQLIRLALFTADAVNQDDTTDPLFRLPELLSWATQATWDAEAELRRAKEDFGLLLIQSNDVAYRWNGITYNPAVLQLTSTTLRVALPPDLLTLKSLRCITSGSDRLTFREVDLSSPEFKEAQSYGFRGGTSDGEILYDVVGENTLVLAYPPSSTVDLEMTYISRTAPLQIYSTGTVTTQLASASVSGGSTAWVADEVENPLELIVSADATAPKVVSATTGGTWVDPSRHYSPVQSIDSDGGLTLAGAWLLADAVGKGYLLASIPPVPPEHHMQIVDGLASRIKLKAENRGSDAYAKLADKASKRMMSDVTERQLDTRRVVEDYVAG
jgi:hypothetical protein